ncbi:MAG: hypothetical protein ACFCU1_03690 [Sumerlaeia bacterium]
MEPNNRYKTTTIIRRNQATHGVVWLFFVISLLISTANFADDVILDDGLEYRSVLVHSFNRFPDGGVFVVRVQDPSGAPATDHPIEEERVRVIRFQDPEFNAQEGVRVYRKANIRLINGEILQDLSLSSLRFQNDSLVLTTKPGTTFPHNQSQIMPFSEVHEMLLSIRDYLPSMEIAPASSALSTPNPIAEPTPDDLLDAEQPLGTQLLGGGDYVGEEIIPDLSSASNNNANDYEYEFDLEDDSGSWGRSNRGSSWFIIPVIGAGVGFISLIVYLLVTSIFGGIYLFIASRVEGVNDFPLWKSFIAAGALAVFPMISFLLCAKFIPYFGFAIGLLTIYGIARAIVMGAMEIMEEKAEGVLWTFMLVQILIFFLSTSYL